MTFSKKNHSTHLFKIFFSLLTLSTVFLQKACGPGKNTFSFIKLQQYCNVSEDIESIFFEISNQQYTATVGVIYRPPNGNISNFLKCIAGILETASSNKQDTVIMGDFNINMFHENRSSSCFEEVILCNGFTPTVSVATHAKPNCSLSCIDNIIVNNPQNIVSSGVIDTHISHHRSLFLTCSLHPENNIGKSSNVIKIRLLTITVRQIWINF